MESEDYEYYKGLEFLIQNRVEDLGYDLSFSTEIREFGVTEVRDMIPNGRNIGMKNIVYSSKTSGHFNLDFSSHLAYVIYPTQYFVFQLSQRLTKWTTSDWFVR